MDVLKEVMKSHPKDKVRRNILAIRTVQEISQRNHAKDPHNLALEKLSRGKAGRAGAQTPHQALTARSSYQTPAKGMNSTEAEEDRSFLESMKKTRPTITNKDVMRIVNEV